MIRILTLKDDTIDEIARLTGQSKKTLKVKLKKANEANPRVLVCFTINTSEWRKI